MAGIKETIKIFLRNFSARFLVAEEIKNDDDFRRVNTWVEKTSKSYKRYCIAGAIFTILSTILVGVLLKQQLGINGIATFFLSIVLGIIYLIVLELAFMGLATMKMHSKEVFKSAWTAAKFGYEVGEKIQTTHVDVTHEYGNTYKVSTRTEDKGLLVAVICVSCIVISWMAYCVYKGTFLTMKKIKASKENLSKYTPAQI